MFWGSPLFDFILIISTIIFLKHYLFLKDLNDEEKRFVLYSATWVRILVVLSILGEIVYVVASDIALFDGKYYFHALCMCSVTIYICALWGIYIGYMYGPKTQEYKEGLRIRILSAVVLLMIFMFICLL